MDNQKEIISLRILAARCISTNEIQGLNEIDRVSIDLYHRAYWQYLRLWSGFIVTLFFTAIILITWIGWVSLGIRGSEVVLAIGLIPLSLLFLVLWRWRSLQYGGMTARKPQQAVYANPDDPAVRNLELLFAVLQLENTPRAFYRTKGGAKREIDERYFFGTLRMALLSKERPLRDMFFSPVGFWFSRELFMEVDVAALIAQAKAKPNQAGAKKTYDYTDAITSLIEHPVIREMEIGKRGNLTKIVNLLEASYIARRETPPSENQLAVYAKPILEAITKNRSAKS